MRLALRPGLGKSIAIRSSRILRASPAGLISWRVNHQHTRQTLSTTSNHLVQPENDTSEKRNGARTSKEYQTLVAGSYDYQALAIREAFRNAPLFSPAALNSVESFVSNLPGGNRDSELVSRNGIVGTLRDVDANDNTEQEEVETQDRLVVANLDFPWSAVICGSKGSGKSQTLACLVENALSLKADPDAQTGDGIEPSAGKSRGPPAAIMFHFNTNAEMGTTKPCQAADMCHSGKIPVKVVISTANLNLAVNHSYEELVDIFPHRPVRMLPLYLHDHHLNTERVMRLMAVDPLRSERTMDSPHLDPIRDILDDMASSGTGFVYSQFRERLDRQKWTEAERESLGLRLAFLETLIKPKTEQDSSEGPAAHQDEAWEFQPGSLTIVDLSHPHLNPEAACALFSVVLSIFMEGQPSCGRIVAMDDAHGILTQATEGKRLTKELESVMRQQRLNNTSVMIATQEPAGCPELVALSDACFIHATLEPEQVTALQNHLDRAHAASEPRVDASGTHERQLSARVAGLRIRDALVFCPAARLAVEGSQEGVSSTTIDSVPPLGSGVAKVRVRRRATPQSLTAGHIGSGGIAGLHGDELLFMHAMSDNDVTNEDDIWEDEDDPDLDQLLGEDDIAEQNDTSVLERDEVSEQSDSEISEKIKTLQHDDIPGQRGASEKNDESEQKGDSERDDSSDWDDDGFGDDDDFDIF